MFHIGLSHNRSQGGFHRDTVLLVIKLTAEEAALYVVVRKCLVGLTVYLWKCSNTCHVSSRGASVNSNVKTHQNVCSFKLIDCSFWTNASEFFKWCLDCWVDWQGLCWWSNTNVYGSQRHIFMNLWFKFNHNLFKAVGNETHQKTDRQTDMTFPFCTLVQITHPVLTPIKSFTPCLLICLYDIVLSHKGNPTFTNATYLREGMIKPGSPGISSKS
jgi:hypothetical protein